MNTVKCVNSLSIYLYLMLYANMPLNLSLTIYCTLRLQNQFIAVLVVTSFNAKLYWPLNIFKNISKRHNSVKYKAKTYLSLLPDTEKIGLDGRHF